MTWPNSIRHAAWLARGGPLVTLRARAETRKRMQTTVILDECDEIQDALCEAAVEIKRLSDRAEKMQEEVEAVRRHFGWKRDGRSLVEILEARERRDGECER